HDPPPLLRLQNGALLRIVIGATLRLSPACHDAIGDGSMQYRTLGRTGVQVSSLVLGAMNFGTIGRTTQDEVTAIVDAALAGGVNLIDTADMYSQGESEQLVGRAIAGRRDDVVLATKAALPMGEDP